MKLDSLLTDPAFDPCVALLMATDLTLDEVLGLRVVLLSHPARVLLSRLIDGARPFDSRAMLFPAIGGRLPTRSALLRSVSVHLDLLQDYRSSPVVLKARRRLAGLLVDAVRAA